MKYKKLVTGIGYAWLACLGSDVCAQAASTQTPQAHFTLEGTLQHMKLQFPRLYLVYDSAVTHAPDSAVVKGNTYVFTGSISQPCLAYITPVSPSAAGTVNGKPRFGQPKAAVFVTPGKITVVSQEELENMTVKGSQAHTDFWQSDSLMLGLYARTAGIRSLANETDLDMLLQNAVTAAIMPMTEKQHTAKIAFMQKHPASVINPWLIWSLLTGDVKTGMPAALQNAYNNLPAQLQNSETGIKAKTLLAEELKAVVGNKAPDFEQTDTEGHPVNLDAYKGKFLLLDFWSSNNAAESSYYIYLKQAYATYKSKGLEVLSVSLDTDTATWKAGMQAFHFAWSNADVFNHKGTSLASVYGISAPLKNVLVGPDGTIVAKNIGISKIGEILTALLD